MSGDQGEENNNNKTAITRNQKQQGRETEGEERWEMVGGQMDPGEEKSRKLEGEKCSESNRTERLEVKHRHTARRETGELGFMSSNTKPGRKHWITGCRGGAAGTQGREPLRVRQTEAGSEGGVAPMYDL